MCWIKLRNCNSCLVTACYPYCGKSNILASCSRLTVGRVIVRWSNSGKTGWRQIEEKTKQNKKADSNKQLSLGSLAELPRLKLKPDPNLFIPLPKGGWRNPKPSFNPASTISEINLSRWIPRNYRNRCLEKGSFLPSWPGLHSVATASAKRFARRVLFLARLYETAAVSAQLLHLADQNKH